MIILGFLSLGTVTSRSSQHLSLIEVLRSTISAGVPALMRTQLSFSDLKDLTPIFIAVRFTFVFKACLIASVERFSFEFTSSLYRLSTFELTNLKYSFFGPPIDGM